MACTMASTALSSFTDDTKLRGWWICWRAGLLFRWTTTGGQIGWDKPQDLQQSSKSVKNSSVHKYRFSITVVKKVNHLLNRISKNAAGRWREAILPLYLSTSFGIVPGVPSTRRTLTFWSDSRREPQRWSWGGSTWHMGRGWEVFFVSAWRKEG